jgi:hypothetical protein
MSNVDVLFLVVVLYLSACFASLLKFKFREVAVTDSFMFSIFAPIFLLRWIVSFCKRSWETDTDFRSKCGSFLYIRFLLSFALGVMPVMHTLLIDELCKILKSKRSKANSLKNIRHNVSYSNSLQKTFQGEMRRQIELYRFAA